MLTLGVDPGTRDGACVVLDGDGRRVVDWVAWWTLSRTKRLPQRLVYMRKMDEGHQVAARLVDVFARIAQRYQGEVVVEDIWARKGPRNNHSSVVKVATAAGIAIGALAGCTMRPEVRVPSDVWRRQVLGIDERARGACGSEAEAAHVAGLIYIPGRGRAPLFDFGPMPAGLVNKEALGALAEAACIARWGHVTRTRRDALRRAG